jgi:hypothetical protein
VAATSEQILIEFIADSSQLEGVIPVLQKIGNLSQADADALKKIASQTNSTSRTADAAGTKMGKTIGDVEKKAKKLADTFDKSFKDGMADALAEAGVSLEDFQGALDKAGISLNDVKDKVAEVTAESDGLKKELRETSDAMAVLVKNGQRNSEEYGLLAEKAAELKKAIGDANKDVKAFGSDTRGLDAVQLGARGVAGGFALAEGASALFGQENEDLQKSLLKVNAAMSILAGFKELSDLANSREFASLSALIGAQKLNTLQTNLQAGAESKNIAIRYAAIIAQKALNLVMAISPLGLIAIAVGAIAAAWFIFSKNVAEAAAEQEKLNQALNSAGKYLDIDLKSIDNYSEKLKTVLKERGATTDEITRAEADAANKRIKRINDEITAIAKALNASKATDEEGIKAKQELSQKQLDLQIKLQDEVRDLEIKASEFRRKQYEDDLKSYEAYADARVLEAKKGSIAELQAEIDAVKARAEVTKKLNPDLTKGDLAKLAADTTRQIQELSNQITVQLLTDQKYLMDAKVATLRAGSVEELEERKKIAAKAAEIELAQLGITEAKKQAIRAEEVQTQIEFDRQISDIRIQEELNAINRKIALARTGSEKEYQLQKDSLEKQFQLEINQKGISDSKKLQLTAEYYKKVEDMEREHNLKLAELAINARKLQINADLAELDRASTSENNSQLLELKKQLIDQETALEIVQAQASINNAAELTATLFTIYAQGDAKKAALEDAAKKRTIQDDLEVTNLIIENQKKQAELDASTGSFQKRIAARKEYHKLVIQQIDEEEKAYDEMWAEGLITYEEYNKKLLEIEGKRIDLQIEKEQKKEETIRQIASATVEALQQGADAIFENNAAHRQADLEASLASLQKQHDAEISNKNLTEEQKAAIDDRYRIREAQIKKAAWLKDRQARISQAVVNGLLAATSALATVVPTYPAGAIAAAAAIVSAGISVAKIKSEPIPQFKKGTSKAPPGYALVGEEGPEVVRLNGGEKIWTYSQSQKITDAWRGGSSLTPDQILAGFSPKADNELMGSFTVNKYPGHQIDYDAFGDALAKRIQIPEAVQVQNVIDEDGLALFVHKKGNRTKILNKYYKIN